MNDELEEKVAKAISLEMKRQWGDQEIIKELNDPTSWSAEGGVLDLTLLAQAAMDVIAFFLEENMAESNIKEIKYSSMVLGELVKQLRNKS